MKSRIEKTMITSFEKAIKSLLASVRHTEVD